MKRGTAHLVFLHCSVVFLTVMLFPGAVLSEEDWRTELEEVCAQTDISMTLSKEELQVLISRCEELEKKIGAEDKVVRKIYLRRLKRCRDLFAYVLESKTEEPAEGQGAASPSNPSEEDNISQMNQGHPSRAPVPLGPTPSGNPERR